MKNTEFSIDSLRSFVSSEQSFDDILDMMREFDLEITDIRTL